MKRDYLKHLGFHQTQAMNINLNNTDNNDYVRGYKDGKKAGATEWAGKADDNAFIRGYACCLVCIIQGHGISTEVEDAFKAGIGSIQRCVDANCEQYDIDILKKHFN